MKPRIKFYNPDGLYDPSSRGYTHVAIAPTQTQIVYISGQIGEDENGNLATNDFAAQIQQVFKNLHMALYASGAQPKQVAKITVLVVDVDEIKLELLGASIKEIWGDQAPASTLIPVSRLALDNSLIEIEATAFVSE